MGKSGPGRLRHRVGEAIADGALWSPGDQVAVAVSGGLDSVVLLDLLMETSGWHKGELSVVTVSHGTRVGSTRDASFVESLCAAKGVPCIRSDLELGEAASELQCREARYRVFEELAVERVALAHHLDDQAETLLLQMLRGAGSQGLGAMRWRRGKYVRPFLGVRRAELESWATWRGLEWVEDPTNQSPCFDRNRIRHEVLPLLESIRAGVHTTLARTADNLASDAEYLSEQASSLIKRYDFEEGVSLSELAALSEPIRRRILASLSDEMSANQIRALEIIVFKRGGALELGEFFRVEALSNRLFVRKVK